MRDQIKLMRAQIKACNEDENFVFISYKSDNAETVFKCVLELQKRGVNLWIDKELENRLGEEWNEVVFSKLKQPKCRCILFFMSEESMTSVPVCIEHELSRCKQVCQRHQGKPMPIYPLDIRSSSKGLQGWIDELAVYTGAEHKIDEHALEYLKDKIEDYDQGIKCIDDKFDVALRIYEKTFNNNQNKTYAPPENYDAIVATLKQSEVFASSERAASQPAQAASPQAAAPSNTSAPATAPLQNVPADSPGSAADNKKKFKEWLVKSGKSEYTANNYIAQLRGGLIRGLKVGDAISENLFEYSDFQNFEQVCEMILRVSPEGTTLPNSLIAYSDFLKALSATTLPQPSIKPEIVCKHTVTKTDNTYGLIRFKKSTDICKVLTPNMAVTLRYGDITHNTKVHSVEMGRISSVPFIKDIPAGTELTVEFDGANTITLTNATLQGQGEIPAQ